MTLKPRRCVDLGPGKLISNMKNITNASLAFNCSENVGRKHFCEKCRHRVIDFRNKTEIDLMQEINEALGHVCGIFNTSQLSDTFLKYAAATVIVTSLAIPTHGQETNKLDSLLKAYDESAPKEEEDVFIGTIVEVMPEPVGGNEKFLEAIRSKIIYPVGLAEKGRTYIQFLIDSTGQMKDVTIMKGFNELADKEALRVMSSLNYPFIPARQGGKPVSMRFVIPVIFDPGIKPRRNDRKRLFVPRIQ
jgi:TonB family protein